MMPKIAMPSRTAKRMVVATLIALFLACARANRPTDTTTTSRQKAVASSKNNNNKETVSLRRIQKEYKDAIKTGIAYDWVHQKPLGAPKNSTTQHHQILIGPLASNMRHWHFSFRGLGVYSTGIYHGRIALPKDYPASPPSVQLWTPNGRFATMKDICLEASNFHPETWIPTWTVENLVHSLRLHMLTSPNQIGGMSSPYEKIQKHAQESLTWSITFPTKSKKWPIVKISHAKMMQQGLFRTNTQEDETLEASSSLMSSSRNISKDTTDIEDNETQVDLKDSLGDGDAKSTKKKSVSTAKGLKQSGSSLSQSAAVAAVGKQTKHKKKKRIEQESVARDGSNPSSTTAASKLAENSSMMDAIKPRLDTLLTHINDFLGYILVCLLVLRIFRCY